MEDQGKRLLLAVAAAFAVLLVWDLASKKLFPPPEPPPGEQTPDRPKEGGEGPSRGDSEPSGGPDLAESPGAAKVDRPSGPQLDGSTSKEPAVRPSVHQRGEEQTFEFDFPKFRAVFTSYGAALKSWELSGEKYYESVDGVVSQVDLVRAGKSEELLPFRIGFAEREWWPEKTEWRGKRKSDTEIEFTWSYVSQDGSGAAVPVFDLVKTYELFPDDYLLQLTIDVVNRRADDKEKQSLYVSLYGYQDPAEDTEGGWTQVESSCKSTCYIDE